MNKITISLISVIYITTGISTCTYAQETGSFTDSRDATVYKTVKIGDQWWMSENLAYKSNSGCFTYEDIEDYVKTHGYLYNWETAKNVCPDGWHLPSNAEFVKLANFLGGPDVAGGKLKEAGTTHWNSPNAGATNSTGFSALSSGRSNDNEYKAYLGLITYFWSTDEFDVELGAGHALYSAKTEFSHYGLEKDGGFSVRCIKD